MQSHIHKVYACLAVTCRLHFWQNDRGLLRATAVTREWNGYRNKSQHRKLTLEKKILPPLLQGFEPATFQSWVRRSNHWAIPAVGYAGTSYCWITTALYLIWICRFASCQTWWTAMFWWRHQFCRCLITLWRSHWRTTFPRSAFASVCVCVCVCACLFHYHCHLLIHVHNVGVMYNMFALI